MSVTSQLLLKEKIKRSRDLGFSKAKAVHREHRGNFQHHRQDGQLRLNCAANPTDTQRIASPTATNTGRHLRKKGSTLYARDGSGNGSTREVRRQRGVHEPQSNQPAASYSLNKCDASYLSRKMRRLLPRVRLTPSKAPTIHSRGSSESVKLLFAALVKRKVRGGERSVEM